MYSSMYINWPGNLKSLLNDTEQWTRTLSATGGSTIGTGVKTDPTSLYVTKSLHTSSDLPARRSSVCRIGLADVKRSRKFHYGKDLLIKLW